MLHTVVASLPSPSFEILEIGPLPIRMYGLCIALGVIAAVTISSKRWGARGGNPDDIGTIALWAVPAGVIGARLYHVMTDWKSYRDDWGAAFNITNGGLGIPGGIFLGVLVGVIVVKVKKLPVRPLLDVVAPALPVAQAIGRLGNWFNQELFGSPTKLPWGLEVDADKVPSGYAPGTLFHPTFLYEALWNLALAGLLVVLDRRKRLRPGELFTLYVLGYAIGRLWVEELRIDPASLLLGIRVNIWMSVIVGVGAALFFVLNRRRPAEAADAVAGPSAGSAAEGAAPAGDGEDEDARLGAEAAEFDDGYDDASVDEAAVDDTSVDAGSIDDAGLSDAGSSGAGDAGAGDGGGGGGGD